MSPLPAPDPTSQQWPNLVWKRATMGEPTGPLISRSPPPHSSYRSEREQHRHRYKPSSCTKMVRCRAQRLNKWSPKLSQNSDSNSLIFPLLTILNPPSPPLRAHSHTWSWPSITPRLIRSCIPALFSLSEPGFLSAWGPSCRGYPHAATLGSGSIQGMKGENTHTHTPTQAQTLTATLRNWNITIKTTQTHRPSAKRDGLMCWIWAEEAIVVEDLDGCEVEKKVEYMWCEACSMRCFLSCVWDELKVLPPLGQCIENQWSCPTLCEEFLASPVFWESETAADLFEVVANWLVISVYYLAINTQRQWAQRMWH